MKRNLFFLIGLWCLSLAAFGELSVRDLEKIRGIVKESEDRLRAEIALVRAEIVAVEERLRSESTESEARTGKQLDRNFTLLVALIGFVAVVTGIPLTLVILQMQKERDRDAQLSAQQQQIDAQRQLIEALQQQFEGMHRDVETLKQHSMFR